MPKFCFLWPSVSVSEPETQESRTNEHIHVDEEAPIPNNTSRIPMVCASQDSPFTVVDHFPSNLLLRCTLEAPMTVTKVSTSASIRNRFPPKCCMSPITGMYRRDRALRHLSTLQIMFVRVWWSGSTCKHWYVTYHPHSWYRIWAAYKYWVGCWSRHQSPLDLPGSKTIHGECMLAHFHSSDRYFVFGYATMAILFYITDEGRRIWPF